jgi:small redox-active disulfide protein 2
MKTIKVLGTGCPKCQTLTTTVKNFVEQHQIKDVQIEKVEDIMKIMEYNVMTTPALVINEVVKTKGRIPSEQELSELLLEDR